MVLGELIEHGARRALRVGCGSRSTGLAPGDTVVVGVALTADGTSKALGAMDPSPDPTLTRALLATVGGDAVAVASSDLFDDPSARARRHAWRAAGAAIADLERAAVLALGARRGLATGAALVIAEATDGRRAGDELTDAALLRLGCACANALERPRKPLRDRAGGPGGALIAAGRSEEATQRDDLVDDLVEPVLEHLESRRERAQPLLQPLDIRARGEVERVHRRALG